LRVFSRRLPVLVFPDKRLCVEPQVVGVSSEGSLHVHGRQYVEVLPLQFLEVPRPDLRRLLGLMEGDPSLLTGLLENPA